MKVYEIQQLGIENLQLAQRDKPQPKAHEVVVKIHAASVNYRDLMVINGVYNPNLPLPHIPFSDGAGEIVAVGENVNRWKIGDRVCPIFTQGWIDGENSAAKLETTLGGGYLEGILREYAAFDEQGLVRIPEHLTYEEAATLPCAAVTAWNALVTAGGLKAGDTVLTQGTGGVSIFALQFAKLHGAQVIATSSSDDKLKKVRELGADVTINYKTSPDWDGVVLEKTGGVGVDHVVEVGGAGTFAKSLNAIKVGGHIGVIGVLSSGGEIGPIQIIVKSAKLSGIYVGSRRMFEDMNRAIELAKLNPVIDRTFAFEEVHEALKYMASGAHFGKIVVKF